MMDKSKIESIIREEISKLRKLGEHAGGSGHLAYRSLIKFELSEPKEIKYEDKEVFEVICKYDIYTETEFLHPPENDEYYTEHYTDKFILDKDLKILTTDK
jgi:hypothetical protein